MEPKQDEDIESYGRNYMDDLAMGFGSEKSIPK